MISIKLVEGFVDDLSPDQVDGGPCLILFYVSEVEFSGA